MTSTNQLKNIFLMPCWGGKIKDHFEKTVLHPVSQAIIFPAVSEETRADLAAIGNKDIAVWGSMDGSNNRGFFNKMKPGDYILFAVNREVKLVGQIALKTISPELSKILWPDGQRVFSLIYFIDRIVQVNTSLSKVLAAFGYSEAYLIRGLTAVSEERLKGFYASHLDILSVVTDPAL
jgi:hypothetical protein